MGVEPIGPDVVGVKGIQPGSPGFDRVLGQPGHAVLLTRHIHSVPVHRGGLRQPVGDGDLDPIALVHAQLAWLEDPPVAGHLRSDGQPLGRTRRGSRTEIRDAGHPTADRRWCGGRTSSGRGTCAHGHRMAGGRGAVPSPDGVGEALGSGARVARRHEAVGLGEDAAAALPHTEERDGSDRDDDCSDDPDAAACAGRRRAQQGRPSRRGRHSDREHHAHHEPGRPRTVDEQVDLGDGVHSTGQRRAHVGSDGGRPQRSRIHHGVAHGEQGDDRSRQ